MIVRSWRIEGYGVFAGQVSPELVRGVNVILGPNEAGKSTLLSFLRQVLFGFPARKSDGDFIPALKGGAHGGRVVLEDEAGGRWTVERFRDRKRTLTLTTPEGAAVGEPELTQLLGNLDISAYRSVFGFDLADLAKLDAMGEPAVRGRLMSAGISGAGDSAEKARKVLEKRLDELLKARAGGELNDLADRHRELLKQREEAASQLGSYAELALRQANDEKAQKVLSEEMEVRRTRIELLKTLIKWKPAAVKLEEARARLAELALCVPFPENGLARFEQHLERIRGFRQRISEIERSLLTERGREKDLATDDRWLNVGTALGSFDRDAGEQKARLREVGRLETEMASARAELKKVLAALGSGWTVESVREAPVDALKATAARGYEKRLGEAEAQLNLCKRSLAAATGRLSGLQAALDPQAAEKPDRLVGGVVLAASAALLLLTYFFVEANAVIGYLASVAFFVVGLYFMAVKKSTGVSGERGTREVEISHARIDLARSAQLEKQAYDDLSALKNEWGALYASWKLSKDLPMPDSAVELCTLLEAAKKALTGIAELEGRSARVATEIAGWEKEVSDLLKTTPYPYAGEVGERLVESVRAAASKADAEAKKEIEAQGVREAVAKLEGDRLALLESVKVEVGAADKLSESAGAAGEEDFRRLASRHAKRMLVEEELSASLRSLKSQFGDDLENSPETRELFSSSVESWTGELNGAQAELREVAARVTELNRSIGENGIRLRELERSSKVTEIEAELEAVKTRAGVAAREWLKTALAAELLRRAFDRYVRERQPGVLAEASRLFSIMTGGRYLRVIQPPASEEIRVEREDGALCDVAALSRGTREELYLCIRLGLATDFAGRGANLPILADDVFVNFDPERANAALRALCAFAGGRQAILFTCHPETAARVRAVCPEAALFGLDRGTGELGRLPAI